MTEVLKDWNDAYANGESVRDSADRVWADELKIHPKPGWRESTITAAALQRKAFKPVSYVIPDLIPEGLSILCGRPKVGKSWCALELALAVASGKTCLGDRQPVQGDVLYCALEDNYRRLKRRIEKLADGDWPDSLTLTTTWKRLDKGGVQDITEWIRETKDPRMIILDTLAGVKPIRTNSGYAEDYESLTHLHRVANEVGVAVLVLHHTRKQEADDPLDTISGTLGLAGCADTALVFAGTSQGMTLYVRGRDVEEAEHAVSFDKASCRWVIIGDAADVQRSDTRKAILRVLSETNEPMGPSDIAAAAGLNENVVKQRLHKMVPAGEVVKYARARYGLP